MGISHFSLYFAFEYTFVVLLDHRKSTELMRETSVRRPMKTTQLHRIEFGRFNTIVQWQTVGFVKIVDAHGFPLRGQAYRCIGRWIRSNWMSDDELEMLRNNFGVRIQ